MITKIYSAIPDGKCCICKEAEAVTQGKMFCQPCQDELIRREWEPVRTYIGYERLGRKHLDQSRFDWDYTDFDAEFSLGGRPDYDAWFAPEEENDVCDEGDLDGDDDWDDYDVYDCWDEDFDSFDD